MNVNLIGYIGFGLTIVALFISMLSMRGSMRAYREASIRNVKLVSMKRLTAIETELTEIVDSMSAMHDSLKKLRSRIGMRNLRARRSGGDDDLPDSVTEPQAYKAEMRRRLKLNQ